MTLDSPLTDLKGVGKDQAVKFAALGVHNIDELINYYPRRYEDYSSVTAINNLRPGIVTIEASIKQSSGRYVRRGLHITEAIASDKTGSVRLVWFNQPYRNTALKRNKQYFISGQYELSRQRFVIINPSVEMVSDLPINTARILAVYRETKGLSSRQIRTAIHQIKPLIEGLTESLPLSVFEQNKLISRAEALTTIHMPKTSEQLMAAKRRLGFEEVLVLSLASLLNKQENQRELALSIPFHEQLAKDFVNHLPFKLTDGQRLAIWQACLDLNKTQPMNRLLEGDVGSGKTVVATMVALMVLEQGWQVAFMAPTELLARQHAETIFRLLLPLGQDKMVNLLVGSLKASDKKTVHESIKSGQARFIIGTQAIIQQPVNMSKLALIIIDEQHRFGVEQRKVLMSKAGRMPHVLSLSATPIPRSLALTLYGELDISILAEKPGDRKPVITRIVSPNSRSSLYKKIDIELAAGRQMFVVCPLITDNADTKFKSVEQVYDDLSNNVFNHRRIGLLHGKLKPLQKQTVMEKFVAGDYDIIVSTTVVEVGVDVPNATIMLIEGAERFGLSQLHQLRGRVGRGKHQGYCYLMLSDSQPASRRLRTLEQSNDGFKLAELDLELRGPGAIYGTFQHGQLDLRIAQLSDSKLIAAARGTAQKLLENKENLIKYKRFYKTITRLRAVTNLN
ncbi:MAG TPA: ATP-dependent DNA helicase RecG [Candidatus Saccharimonadales bacterium]|nr:ATP-dependent DNA helicase RecG [Candidatus Saccharimonadales bacterium]